MARAPHLAAPALGSPETLVRYAWIAAIAGGKVVADLSPSSAAGAPLLARAGAARVVAVVPAGAAETLAGVVPATVELLEDASALEPGTFDLVVAGPTATDATRAALAPGGVLVEGDTPPPGVPEALLAAGTALLEATSGATTAFAAVRAERAALRDEHAREDEVRALRAALEASEVEAAQVAAQDVELHLLRRRIEAAEAERDAARAEAAEAAQGAERLVYAEKALRDINGSLSWKITAPLRRRSR